MLYIGYLIIVNAQNIKIFQFRKIPFLSCRGWKTALPGYASTPLPPPPPPQTAK